MQKIDGRKIRNEILEDIKRDISFLSFKPVFCDILVGDDPASAQYVKMKAKTAESIGISFHKADFPKNISTEDLIEEIKKIQEIPNIAGIIVQLPLPETIEKQKVLDVIKPELDVDCLSQISSDLFYQNKNKIIFPTALACIHILDSLNLDLSQKNIVVIGQGMLVGKPVTHILKNRGYKIKTIRRKTENANEILKNADVIISATGQGKFINGQMVKKDVIIIDAGTSESTGGVVGDVDLNSVQGVASFVSPVPGGVGPVTVAMLLKNVLLVAQNSA